MAQLIRNQTDASKKKYNNILVRCGQHGWECPDLKRQAEIYSMHLIHYGTMHCFHYHNPRGCNFKNFKERFSGCMCDFSYIPIPGGLNKNLLKNQKRSSGGNRRRNVSDSRSRSRSNSRSPPPRQAATQRIINYQPDEAQSKAILEGRLASLEASERDYKIYKSKNDVRMKKLEDAMKKAEKAWNKSNETMKTVFETFAKKEDLPEERLQDTESVLTFGGAASPAVDDHEPESNSVPVNQPNVIIPPWFVRVQPKIEMK